MTHLSGLLSGSQQVACVTVPAYKLGGEDVFLNNNEVCVRVCVHVGE